MIPARTVTVPAQVVDDAASGWVKASLLQPASHCWGLRHLGARGGAPDVWFVRVLVALGAGLVSLLTVPGFRRQTPAAVPMP